VFSAESPVETGDCKADLYVESSEGEPQIVVEALIVVDGQTGDHWQRAQYDDVSEVKMAC